MPAFFWPRCSLLVHPAAPTQVNAGMQVPLLHLHNWVLIACAPLVLGVVVPRFMQRCEQFSVWTPPAEADRMQAALTHQAGAGPLSGDTNFVFQVNQPNNRNHMLANALRAARMNFSLMPLFKTLNATKLRPS